MSLHGTIEINTALIGTYVIRRTEPLNDYLEEHHYEWAVTINDQEIHGECYHRYEEGAIVLISKVMREAADEHIRMGGTSRSPGWVRGTKPHVLHSLPG